ncbi:MULTISPECIES: FecR family protein [unclassified Achromobacter]|uniref:FecR family protein n=1 Tax=unclassified Achromobacter TaxID=2626865 RepID=UPI000B51D454|nr:MULTISPECIES: FecR family protein [unclassified Achromobacter]OWT69081.1 iron dicitrate transport regulator FecR [Achromobacter sp. HZ34]OWT70486.1 iron dicitrate transport regulator FecR [Achromobacter sp. HZ28]
MTEPIHPDSLTDPRDAAAYWFARVRSDDMSASERHRFEAWRRADPANEKEYLRTQGIWNATGRIPADRLRALMAEGTAPGAVHRGHVDQGQAARGHVDHARQGSGRPGMQRPVAPAPRRRLVFGLGLGTACCVAVAAGVALPRWLETPSYDQSLATGHGERRQVALPDDSVIELNTDTNATVRLYGDRRVVDLSAGEAAFTVSHNAARPFYVQAGATTVRVTGTRFVVRQDADTVLVAVESGSVEVSNGPWWQRDKAALTGGQSVRSQPGGGLNTPETTDVAALLAWRQGRVIFRDTRLALAVAEINRYARTPIQLADASLADIRIAGVFSTENTQAFLDLLPTIAPVRVRHLDDGRLVIQRR